MSAADSVSTGAAADSADGDHRLSKLPRLLRYALLVSESVGNVHQRLIAEIDELCPNLSHNTAYAAALDQGTGLTLAAELDGRAVREDKPNLRSLADCVRLLCLPLPRDANWFEDYRRVGKALIAAFSKITPSTDEQLRVDLEQFVFGWAALPACTDLLSSYDHAAANASTLGREMTRHQIAAAKLMIQRQFAEKDEERRAKEKTAAAASQVSSAGPRALPEDHIVVARLSPEELKNVKLKDILGPLRSAINVPLPLIQVPPLHEVRHALIMEFPYAADVIDFALADLVGRTTIRLRPLLLVGDPGGGKTSFVRKLSEALGLPNMWRTDASRADGATFGGTDRRWHSAEPCHAFLAVAQGKVANPIVMIDEIEKAATRTDYGRLWDCLLGFLEPETSARYPDPALQTNLDLSQVSYIATANSLDPLPTPMRDRFRVVNFPMPTADHLGALLPAVLAGLVRERGLDRRWMPPLDGAEHAAIAGHWRGGSVRRLRRIVEVVLRERELRAMRN